MNDEEFDSLIKQVELCDKMGIISGSSVTELLVDAFYKNKKYNKYHGQIATIDDFNSHLNKMKPSFYWATSSEIAQDAPKTSSDSQGVFPPEMIAGCIGESLPPFCFEMNGVVINFDGSIHTPTQLYYHSKELRPMTRSQYAAKIRWNRLRKLNAKRHN